MSEVGEARARGSKKRADSKNEDLAMVVEIDLNENFQREKKLEDRMMRPRTYFIFQGYVAYTHGNKDNNTFVIVSTYLITMIYGRTSKYFPCRTYV